MPTMPRMTLCVTAAPVDVLLKCRWCSEWAIVAVNDQAGCLEHVDVVMRGLRALITATAGLPFLASLEEVGEVPAPYECECGRRFAKSFGLRVHHRSCPIERERSAVFVGAIERGEDPHAAEARWRRDRVAGGVSK